MKDRESPDGEDFTDINEAPQFIFEKFRLLLRPEVRTTGQFSPSQPEWSCERSEFTVVVFYHC